jgi:hypothetical protein
MSIHETLQAAAAAPCALCGTGPCDCAGVHLARVAAARARGYIGPADFAAVITDGDIYTGSTVILDPGRAP